MDRRWDACNGFNIKLGGYSFLHGSAVRCKVDMMAGAEEAIVLGIVVGQGTRTCKEHHMGPARADPEVPVWSFF